MRMTWLHNLEAILFALSRNETEVWAQQQQKLVWWKNKRSMYVCTAFVTQSLEKIEANAKSTVEVQSETNELIKRSFIKYVFEGVTREWRHVWQSYPAY